MTTPRLQLFALALASLAAAGAAGCGGGEIEDRVEPESAQQLVTVAPKGTATTLDVATWNLNWFGSTAEGPTDEARQLANVRDAILGTDFDVWGLQEVVSATAFNNLLSQLPGYTGLLANSPQVAGGSSYYTSGEQKVALIWKTGVAQLSSARLILTNKSSDFAGRPPMEVTLDLELNGVSEQRVFVVVHMKAMSDTASWQKRYNASAALKGYLDATWPTQKVIVLGDWNDGQLRSITSSRSSPYANLVNDTASYGFPTLVLAQAGQKTYCSSSLPIDQQLATDEQLADLVPGSVQVYRLDSVISGYCSSTSNHYPVLARYEVKAPAPLPGQVILDEILANEAGSATSGEAVELVNAGQGAVDLTGWTISTGGIVRHAFAAGTTLAGGRALVVFGGAAGIPAGLTGAVPASSGRLSLSNSGATVVLKDAGAAVVDSVTYPASLAGTDGVSMNRVPDGTPGAPFALHTNLSALPSSPGRRADGSAF